jgi:serine/threonine protein kinase
MRLCGSCLRRVWDDQAVYCPFDGLRLGVAPADEVDPNLGTTLCGQFHLAEAIGSGAVGTVYRAWQSGTERMVAVKLMHPELARDRALRNRFVREARCAARLQHPNVVGVHMVGETDGGLPYIVMELVSGPTLEEVLMHAGTLAPGRAVRIARQIASALAEAHTAGVVHRDLKPANIVIVQRRRAEQVKLLDFGVAKLVGCASASDWEEETTQITREGAIFGTPQYLAPEQAQGGAIDGRADLYALGVLLYQMLSGRPPFSGTAVSVMMAHIIHPPEPLTALAPHVAPRLAAVVMRCLDKDRAARFASADDLASALRAA